MSEKRGFSDLKAVKRINTINLRDDILDFLAARGNWSRELFAERAGISVRTLNEILSYRPEKQSEPNWTRETLEGIMRVLDCDAFYTPQHKMK